MQSDNGTGSPGPRCECGDPIDQRLEPEAVRWVRAYASTPTAELDATAGAILDEANRLLHEHRTHGAGCPDKAAYEARLRVLTEQMPAVLWSTDAHLRVTSITGGGLAKASATPASNMLRSLADLIGAEGVDDPALAAHVRALRGESAVYEYQLRERTYSVHVEPLRGRTGAIEGTVGAAIDLTARKRAEQALARREEQLGEAQRLAQVGSWERDLDTDVETWSDEYFRIYGLEPGAIPATYRHFLERVHPDDVDRVRAAGEAVVRTGEPGEIEFRIVRPDGDVRLLHCRAAVFTDASGRPVRMYGTSQDITERTRAEQERLVEREQRARLDGMLFAAHQLAADATSGLATSTGAIQGLRPRAPLPANVCEAIDAAMTGLSDATRAIAALQRLIEPAIPESDGGPLAGDGRRTDGA